MSKPAARLLDLHACPQIGLVAHVGGPILPPCCPTVKIEQQPAARVGDRAFCVASSPDSIIKGAFPALVGGQPAARLGDTTSHGGTIIKGAATVFIGDAGVSGNPWQGNVVCHAVAANGGRTSGRIKQTYNNCGVESSRQIINQATGSNVTENELLQHAIDNELANGNPGSRPRHRDGGTLPSERQEIMSNYGVDSHLESQNMQNIEIAVAEGRGVITRHDAGELWNRPDVSGNHAIVVTGIEYDENGNRVNVIVNDTGNGTCQQSVPAEQFEDSLLTWFSDINVTNSPIW